MLKILHADILQVPVELGGKQGVFGVMSQNLLATLLKKPIGCKYDVFLEHLDFSPDSATKTI